MNRSLDPKDAALATMTSWVAAIADNINNPVAGISAAVELIERELVACRENGTCSHELMEDSVHRIQERLANLSEYVTELVDLARPQVVRPETVAVADLFASVRASNQVRHALHLESSIFPGAETAWVDRARLRAVLRALVLNGYEAASGADVPRVSLRAQPAMRRGRTGIEVRVEDNGPGFTAAAIERGGEAFFTTKEAGTGLGLAVARKFTDAHGGELELSASAALGGAAVTLFLPHGAAGRPST